MARLRDLLDTPAWTFSKRLYARFQMSRLPLLAAALAYYAAFSLGPLLLLLGGWLGVVLQTQPELADQFRLALTDLVAQLMPLQENSAQVVAQSFETIVRQLSQGALMRSVVSLLVLVWASSGFFTSLQLALEVIFDVPESRGFLRKRLVAILLVVTVTLVIAIEIVGGVMVSGAVQLATLVAERLQEFNIVMVVPELSWLTGVWTNVIRVVVTTAAFAVCFRYLPRRSSSWTGALVGAVFSTVTILLTRRVLLLTFNLERFNLVYGVITSLLLTLLWFYLALLLFLIGALLVAEISVWRRIRSGKVSFGRGDGE